MNAGTPMRFIAANETESVDALAGIDGRIELELKARWRPGNVSRGIISIDTDLGRAGPAYDSFQQPLFQQLRSLPQ
jgi:hypothetical protein